MRIDEFEYFLLSWTDANIFPALTGDNYRLGHLQRSRKVENPGVVRLCFATDLKHGAKMGDYHPVMPVFSSKITDIIRPLNLEYIQLIPTIIRGIGDKLFEYYFWNICNLIPCLDFEASNCIKTSTGSALNLEKIVLDTKKLESIDFSARLIFKLEEARSSILFHKEIVEKIMDASPEGIRFIKLQNYYDGIEFS